MNARGKGGRVWKQLIAFRYEVIARLYIPGMWIIGQETTRLFVFCSQYTKQAYPVLGSSVYLTLFSLYSLPVVWEQGKK